MRHRSAKLLESLRTTASAATKRFTLFFAEGCVDSLVSINDAIKDAQEENNKYLEQDINYLLQDLGIREESSTIEDE